MKQVKKKKNFICMVLAVALVCCMPLTSQAATAKTQKITANKTVWTLGETYQLSSVFKAEGALSVTDYDMAALSYNKEDKTFTPLKEGTTKIQIRADATSTYKSCSKVFRITIKDRRKTPKVSLKLTEMPYGSYVMACGEYLKSYVVTDSDGTIHIESLTPKILFFDPADNILVTRGRGTAIIRITIDETYNYKRYSKEFRVRVTNGQLRISAGDKKKLVVFSGETTSLEDLGITVDWAPITVKQDQYGMGYVESMKPTINMVKPTKIANTKLVKSVQTQGSNGTKEWSLKGIRAGNTRLTLSPVSGWNGPKFSIAVNVW